MPNASIPHEDNKSINFFTLTIDGSSIGDVKLGTPRIPKQVLEIMNAKTGNPKKRRVFLKAPVIDVTTLDLHWDVFAWLIGVTESNITAGTADLDKTIAFKVYEDYAVDVNGKTYESGLDKTTGLALASTATSGGIVYTEDTDYAVDYTNSTVILIVGGAIADGGTVYVRTGKYTTTASKRIYIGKDIVDCEIAEVLLTHDYPKDASGNTESLTIKLYKAGITSDVEIPFGSDDLIGLPLTITGLEDSSQSAGHEWGYVDISTT